MIRKVKKILRTVINDQSSMYKYIAYFYKVFLLYGKLFARIMLFRFPINCGFPKNKKPKVLQLPITYKCNFNCIMCGMRNMSHKEDFTAKELSAILKNPLFKNIRSVGINGGEPFLLRNLLDYIESIINNVPKLRHIYFISNGYFTDQILNEMKSAKDICGKKKIKLHLSISMDGIDDMQDFMRGKAGAFLHAERTCIEILKDKGRYCDSFGLICTITKHNIFRINEVDVWAKENNVPISYNIATVHKRIYNDDLYEKFSIFSDQHARCLSAEFFYGKFIETRSPQYFAIYRYILDRERISSCDFKYDGVTLTPDANISYCATCSKELGNALANNPQSLYMNNLEYKKQLIGECCKSCSHYCGSLTLKGWVQYNKEYLREFNNLLKYRI